MQQQNTTNSGKVRTFGRSLMKYIQDNIPYGSSDFIDNVSEKNPKYSAFYNAGSSRDELINKHSISRVVRQEDGLGGGIEINRAYHQLMYANVDQDKGKRLQDYRIMASYAEVADALDELCDDFLYEDEQNEFAKLTFAPDRKGEFSDTIVKEFNKQFKKILNYFDFKNRGWEYVRTLLVEGELFFEHIIHKDHKDAGILGIVEMPTDLIDPIYDNVQNLEIKGFLLRRPLINPKTNTVEKYDYIPFDKNQLTYIHSGTWNEDRTMRVPFIENCRRAYKQLTLIEDAVVIYRLVRAPERLVFNVDVGNMAPAKSEAYLRKLMHDYWSRKTYDSGKDHTLNTFNPQSTLDSFWFAKRAGSEGTQVTQLAGGANLGELTDLMYFTKKLYKSLKVPTNRLDAEARYEDSSNILREELKFARFIIRQQQRFAMSLKNTLITHLKLNGLWKEWKLKETDFDIIFNPPSAFYTLREQQLFELKAANFNTMAANEFISTTLAQSEYLGWDNEKIKANRLLLQKDAAFAFELAQIQTMGPNWRETLKRQQEVELSGIADGGGPGGGPGGGLGGGGGSALPPDFGPAPDMGSGTEGAEGPAPVETSEDTGSALP